MQFSIFDETDVEKVVQGEPPGDHRLERNIARAAEFLVAYDISRRGHDCFTVGEGLRYDLLADVDGLRRIQVKMTRRAVYAAPGSRSLSYTFGCNKQPLREYAGDIDLFAFVAMDRGVVLYATPLALQGKNLLHLSASLMTPDTSDLSWAETLRGWKVA